MSPEIYVSVSEKGKTWLRLQVVASSIGKAFHESVIYGTSLPVRLLDEMGNEQVDDMVFGGPGARINRRATLGFGQR